MPKAVIVGRGGAFSDRPCPKGLVGVDAGHSLARVVALMLGYDHLGTGRGVAGMAMVIGRLS